jgi:hypothetical protein
MNLEWIKLTPIPAPKLDEHHLNKAVSRLAEITEGWEATGLDASADLVEELRERIRTGVKNGLSFQQCTAIKRREWLLLCLYLNDLSSDSSQKWLPAFDKDIAESVLGKDHRSLKPHLRRLATQLYFTHFGMERIPCLDWFSQLLREAWRAAPKDKLDPQSTVWAEHADILFGLDAPSQVTATWSPGMSVDELANRFEIHKGGRFRERLIEALIFGRLLVTSLDHEDLELCDLVHAQKMRVLMSGQLLGAKAIEIIIARSKKERNSTVPPDWSGALVSFACDPRTPNNDDKFRWWGWATQADKDIAIRALSKISIDKFLGLLKQSLPEQAQEQFERRKKLMLNLFDKGYVIEARLVVARNIHLALDRRTREVLHPSWLSGNGKTSMICLRCVDNVYLIEGTDSFTLRGFLGTEKFPIRGYWESAPRELSDSQFRVYEGRCQIYQKHQGTNWEWGFIHQLMNHGVVWQGIL